MQHRLWVWMAAGFILVMAGASWYIGLVNRSHPAYWPMAGGDAAHSNVAQAPYPRNPSILWTLPLNAERTTAPVVWQDGTVYIAAGTKLVAVSPEGKRRWAWEARTPIYALALGRQGTVYALDEENLTALNPDGTMYWVAPAPVGAPLGLKVGQGGIVYAVGREYLYSVSGTGQLNWRFKGENITAGVAEGPNQQLYVTVGEELYALDHYGDTVWHVPTSVPNRERSITVGPEGNVYLKGRVLSFLDQKGKLLREELSHDPQGWNLVAGKNYLQDGLTRFAADGSKRVWTAPGLGADYVHYVQGNKDGTLLVTHIYTGRNVSGSVLSLYSDVGERIWRMDGLMPASLPAPAGPGRVCLAALTPESGRSVVLACIGDQPSK